MSVAAPAPAKASAADRLKGMPRDLLIALVLFTLALLFPFLFDSGSSVIDDAITALAYVVMALGLNIVVGFAGLLDLGYVAFYALGALAMGYAASGFFSNANIHVGVSEAIGAVPGIHLNFLMVVVIAVLMTAIAGIIIGLPTLRLRGDYIAIVTLAFGEIIYRVVLNGADVKFGKQQLTAGSQGITPVDKVDLPFLAPFTSLNLRPWYWTALAMVALVLFVNFRLRDSRLGRAWIAVREDEVAAAAMGVPLVRVKLWAYAIGASIGGFSGAFLGVYRNTVNVDQFEFGFSVFILAMIIIGGMGNIGGVIAGAVVLSMFERFVLPELNAVSQDLIEFDVTAISFGIFGFFLMAMMILRPEGFIPNRRRKLELHEGDHDEAAGGDESLYAVRG